MQRRRFLAALAASAAVPSAGRAETAEDLLRAILDSGLAPGAVAATAPPRAIATGGLRAAGRPERVGVADRWHLGSVTKSMTAALVARLAAAGRIDPAAGLGATLRPLLPDLHPGWDRTGLDALLTHTAGMEADAGPLALLRRRLAEPPVDPAADRLDLLAPALRRPPEGAGTVRYSNLGFVAAAAMLEATLRRPWEDLVAEEVWRPLGLSTAGLGAPPAPVPGGQALGHTVRPWGGLAPVPPGAAADNVPAYGPAGRVHMTPGDVLRWLLAHAGREEAFLPRTAWDWLHAPAPGTDAAKGWFLAPGGRLWHGGSNTFWVVRAGFDPRSGRVAFLGANSPRLEPLGALFRDLMLRALA